MEEKIVRLQFLKSLLANTNTTKYALAEMMGVSAANIFTYFRRDDMKLSYAQEIADKLGYRLIFNIEGEKQNSSSVLLDIESFVGDEGLSRLAFLQIAMKLNGIQRKVLAEQLDLNYTGVNRWFKVDDIAISYIFKIAELYGLKVSVKAVKKKAVPESITLG
ncbi:MAG: hypothetical protein MJZ16_06145 [Bacteroidales bacterium]|nr:hypothetical protein [Bacteroidales bacterium]